MASGYALASAVDCLQQLATLGCAVPVPHAALTAVSCPCTSFCGRSPLAASAVCTLWPQPCHGPGQFTYARNPRAPPPLGPRIWLRACSHLVPLSLCPQRLLLPCDGESERRASPCSAMTSITSRCVMTIPQHRQVLYGIVNEQ